MFSSRDYVANDYQADLRRRLCGYGIDPAVCRITINDDGSISAKVRLSRDNPQQSQRIAEILVQLGYEQL